MNLRLVVALGSVFFAVSAFGATATEGNSIGTVDMQKALRTVDQGVKAKQKLEGIFNKKKDELQKEEAGLKKLHEEFQKQSMVLSDTARTKKQTDLQQKLVAFQENTARSQMELQKKEQELTSPIIEKLKGLVQEIAKKRGYSMVLEKNENTVLYSQDKDDFTDEVIKEFDKKNKS